MDNPMAPSIRRTMLQHKKGIDNILVQLARRHNRKRSGLKVINPSQHASSSQQGRHRAIRTTLLFVREHALLNVAEEGSIVAARRECPGIDASFRGAHCLRWRVTPSPLTGTLCPVIVRVSNIIALFRVSQSV